jgi:hypothetical protein
MSHEYVNRSMVAAASEGREGFETVRRLDFRGDYVRLKDTTPTWLAELVFTSHEQAAMLPDDWRTRLTRDALSQIANAEPDTTRQELLKSIEPDTYRHVLISWLGSNARRLAYCDDALAELRELETVAQLLAAGQVREKREVFSIVWDVLAAPADAVVSNS